LRHGILAEVALDEGTPSMGSIGSRSSAMMPCPERAHRRPAPGREAAAQVLAPGAGRRPRSTTTCPGRIRRSGLVDLLELVGGAGAIALALGQLDVGVVDVVVEPRLVDLLALGLTFMGRDNRRMTAIQLTPAERKEHRSSAHHLDPVVLIGGDGLTPGRVQGRSTRAEGARPDQGAHVLRRPRRARSHAASLADTLGAAPVQHIGKLLVLWRPIPPKEKAERDDRLPGPRTVKVVSFSKSGNHRATVKKVKVFGNERVTAGADQAHAPEAQ
jgi:RNA-binding protein